MALGREYETSLTFVKVVSPNSFPGGEAVRPALLAEDGVAVRPALLVGGIDGAELGGSTPNCGVLGVDGAGLGESAPNCGVLGAACPIGSSARACSYVRFLHFLPWW